MRDQQARLGRPLGFAVLLLVLTAATVGSADVHPLLRLRGTDFAGGAAALFGSAKCGAARVNYVYAAPTGERSRMVARFSLAEVPDQPLFLFVRGRLDDGGTDCPLKIALNGMVPFEGPNGFAHEWEVRRYAIPVGLLRTGGNEIAVSNTSPQGVVGMPPWFMLAWCAIGDEQCDLAGSPAIEEDFRVALPAEKRPIPEPLAQGHTQPGFKIRGIKGWLWRPEQYLEEIPFLPRLKLNFLMNCYGSMCDIEHHGWGSPECNRWWEPLPEEKRRAYEAVVRASQKRGIIFCFSMNPNIGAARIVRYDSAEDLELLWQHYAWMQSLGVHWFNVQFDDISQGIDAVGQARFVNALLQRLRRHDSEAQMVFCGTYYSGNGQDAAAKAYLEAIARELDPKVYVFWTGDGVVGRITRRAAEAYRQAVGHRLIIWDNYPVNDSNPTLHLGPVTGRDRDLCEVADGYMSNPMASENRINRLPLMTCADYAYNPWAYDPARSIGQAILHLAETPEQQRALKDLVELYPGMLVHGQGTGYNPVVTRFSEILATPHSRWLAEVYLQHVEDVAARLRRHFAGRFTDATKTAEGNLAVMRQAYRDTYGTE